MKEIIGKRFTFVRPGYSFRATELEAAIGVAAMETIDSEIKRRQEIAGVLTKIFSPYKKFLQLPAVPKGRHHVFMMFPIVIVDPSISREKLLTHLEMHGIETRLMLPLINQPFVQKMHGDLSKEFPVAHHINANGFYIGCHSGMKQRELRHIQKTFASFFTSV